jgi:hypothetical protein
VLVEKAFQQKGELKVRCLLVVIQIGLAIPQFLLGSEPTPQQGASTQQFHPISVYIDCPQGARHTLTDQLLNYEDMFEVRTAQESVEYNVSCGRLREDRSFILYWSGEIYSQGKVVETFGGTTSSGVARYLGLAMLRHRLLGKGERNQPGIRRQSFDPVKVSVRVAIPRENESGVSLKELLRNVELQERMVDDLSDARETRGLFEVRDQEADADYAINVTALVFYETVLDESVLDVMKMAGELHHKNNVVTSLFGFATTVHGEARGLGPDLMYKGMLLDAVETLVRQAKIEILRHRLLGQ